MEDRAPGGRGSWAPAASSTAKPSHTLYAVLVTDSDSHGASCLRSVSGREIKSHRGFRKIVLGVGLFGIAACAAAAWFHPHPGHSEVDRTVALWSPFGFFGGQEETSTTTTTTTTVTTLTATSTSSSVTTSVTTHTTSTLPEGSKLYCFVVARPKVGEMELMETQLKKHTGIFQCDASGIFSNVRRTLSNGEREVQTEVVKSSLEAPVGGIYNMSLNSEIFVVVWKRIFSDRRYDDFDWTVKVDPDAVFIPSRLRARVVEQEALRDAKLPKGVYLNNCRIGNHGPIEVISTRGMHVFKEGIERCVDKNYAPFHEIGEDVFTRRCWRHLGVKPLDDFHLLSEINCFENPTPCFSGKAVFHPFKTSRSFTRCLEEARSGKVHLMPSACKVLGCSHHFEGGHPCQCNEQCHKFGNCCDDYKAVCMQGNASGASHTVINVKKK